VISELHLFTVGVSILQNFGRCDVGKEFMGSDRWYRLPPDSPEQQKFMSWTRRDERVFDAVLRFVDSDPRRASIELNTFTGLRVSPVLLRERSLYLPQTPVPGSCARVIEAHLESRGYRMKGTDRG